MESVAPGSSNESVPESWPLITDIATGQIQHRSSAEALQRYTSFGNFYPNGPTWDFQWGFGPVDFDPILQPGDLPKISQFKYRLRTKTPDVHGPALRPYPIFRCFFILQGVVRLHGCG